MGLKNWLLLRQLILASHRYAKQLPSGPISQSDMQRFHNIMLALIKQFQNKFSAANNRVLARDVLLPLVFYLDEKLMKTYFYQHPERWPLLQKSLFNVDHGGILFYQLLDKHLQVQNLPLFIVEMYYFFFKSDFHGRYFNAPQKRDVYLQTLTKKLLASDEKP